MRDEFKELIFSIGFKHSSEFQGRFVYKNFTIDISEFDYDIHDGETWSPFHTLDELEPIKKIFKKELRSIKLKNILK